MKIYMLFLKLNSKDLKQSLQGTSTLVVVFKAMFLSHNTGDTLSIWKPQVAMEHLK